MRVVEGRVRLEVAAQGAAYPLTIDPLLTEEAKLIASDAAAFDQFGISVALSASGKTALIGAVGDECTAGNFCGAAYVFVRGQDGWVERQKLTASDAAQDDSFGGSVALSASGESALIEATGADCTAGDFCGAAYVFVRGQDGWVERQKLTASDAAQDGTPVQA
jgi:FG-GAP repeat protein